MAKDAEKEKEEEAGKLSLEGGNWWETAALGRFHYFFLSIFKYDNPKNSSSFFWLKYRRQKKKEKKKALNYFYLFIYFVQVNATF